MEPRSTPVGWPPPAPAKVRALPVLALLMLCPLCLSPGTPLPAAATDLGSSVDLHGFGGWAFGETDGNRYTVGTENGEYDNAAFALNLNANPYENLNLVFQMDLELENSEVDVELDYAFAEWFFSDAARFRIGRVKHPYGLYAEVFDVGTVRPFFFLPQSIYGPQGFTAKAYNGLGVTGTRYGAGDWGVQYDVYGGQIQGELAFPGPLSANPAEALEGEVENNFEINDLLGLRINLLTPVEGLLFGVSAYSGDERFPDGSEANVEFDRDVYGGHVEYIGSRLWVRTEFAHFEEGDRFEEDGAYLELAYKLTEHWQLAARYDEWDAEIPGIDTANFPDFFQQILEHQETALGLNYWFNPSFVVKLSYHLIEGNRFAFPDDPQVIQQSIFTNDLEDETDLLVFGAQFSF